MSFRTAVTRWFGLAVTAAAFGASMAPAQAHQALSRASQAEQRGPDGRITVEASIITTIACNSPGERGGQYYIYQYVNRPGFRAIMPPNWGQAIGGRDWATYEQATSAACGSTAPVIPPVLPTSDFDVQKLGDGSVRILWSGKPGGSRAWVSIVPVGTPDTKHVSVWRYAPKSAGSMDFAPMAAGSYEARFYLDDSYVVNRRATFSIP